MQSLEPRDPGGPPTLDVRRYRKTGHKDTHLFLISYINSTWFRTFGSNRFDSSHQDSKICDLWTSSFTFPKRTSTRLLSTFLPLQDVVRVHVRETHSSEGLLRRPALSGVEESPKTEGRDIPGVEGGQGRRWVLFSGLLAEKGLGNEGFLFGFRLRGSLDFRHVRG